jgi:hypothetical protein
MRWSFLGLLLLVVGCSYPADVFDVDPGEGAKPQGAALQVCGTESPFRKAGSRLVARRVIDCEGSGNIRVNYLDGTTVDCPIGYVTAPDPFSKEGFQHSFKIERGICRYV